MHWCVSANPLPPCVWRMQVALRRAVRIKAEASSSMQLLRSMLPGHVIRR